MERFLRKIKSHSLREIFKEYLWLIRCSLRYKRQIIWYLVMGIVGTVMSLAGSLLSKYIIDAVTGHDHHYLLNILLFFIFMQLAQIGLNALSSRIGTKISIEVNQQLTSQVYDTLLKTQWDALSAYHSGDLLARLSGDIATVSSSVLGWIPDMFTRLLQFVGTFAMIMYYDATLAVLALLTAPISLLMSRYVIRMMRHHNKEMRRLTSDMVVFNSETFQNLQLLKAFGLTEVYTEKHQLLLDQYRKASLDYNRFSIGKNAVMSLAGSIVALACFCWSIYRLRTGYITFGTVTLFLQLSTSLTAAFSALASMIPSAINAATAAGRIMDITQLPQEEQGDPHLARQWLEDHAENGFWIEAQDLSYHYEDGIPVLSHINFQVKSRQIVALTGPSGEGKTTLLRLLLGIVQPKDGLLQLRNGQDQTLKICAATRSLFAYVPQGNTLFSGTIEENLRLIQPNATEEQLYQALELACAADFVRNLPLGLRTPVKERGGGLSEGQLQRLCIARALLSDAPILLMDEATSALDAETEYQLLQNIMRAEKDRTCILSTHRLTPLEICHKIYHVATDQLVPVTMAELKEKFSFPTESQQKP